MRDFRLSLYDAPAAIRDGTALKRENLLKSAPMAAAMTGAGRLSDICRMYGYVFLLGQNLEFELRECLLNIEVALKAQGKKRRWKGSAARKKFGTLIEMFTKQLDLSRQGSRDFCDQLDRARKLRNWLAHEFFSAEGFWYIRTEGGQEKLIGWLKALETVFFPLTDIINVISRAYAAEFGFTHELVDHLVEEDKKQREQIERDLKSLLDDSSADGES